MNQVSEAPNNSGGRQFNEKAYRRQTLPEWDLRWELLSYLGRYYLLHQLGIRSGSPALGSAGPGVSASVFLPEILEDLRSGGFVEVLPVAPEGVSGRVVVSDRLADFAARAYAACRYRLLDDKAPNELAAYLNHVYFANQLTEVISAVLKAGGVTSPARLDDVLKRYVMDHQWPSWVAKSLNEPLADRIIDVVRNAKGMIRLSDLPERIAGSDPTKVRAVMDKLVARLALFEDIRLTSCELMIGFLPAVRDSMILASLPRERPALLECANPRELGPDGSPVVNDLRAVLIEVASQPPRLRRDQTLFHKEIPRFQTVLDPLAAWLLSAMQWSAEGRVNRAIAWARALQLAKADPEEKQIRLHLAPEGHAWLSCGAPEESLEILRLVGAAKGPSELYVPQLDLFLAETNPWEILERADVCFLGSHVKAIKAVRDVRLPRYAAGKRDDHLVLRKQLDMALAELKLGVFYRLESVESRVAFAEHNPLNLGLPAEQVELFWINRPVPAARAQRDETGRHVIHAFVLQRLVPFGCFRAAIDDEGKICVARGPQYDAYFGREVAPPDRASTVEVAPRVVVQPDFSVVIIGPNPAPAAALAPFCERTSQGGGQRAVVLKVTRESVVRAVKNGLKSEEIMARLKCHASNDPPPNVMRQVQEWSTWVRRVTLSSLIALRCRDSETADRVMAVMKHQAERVNSTVVAIDRKTLTTTERNKLQDHGILVQDEPGDQIKAP